MQIPDNLKREYDIHKNELDINSTEFTSNTLIWWKCDAGPDHSWRTQLRARFYGQGKCQFCLGKQVSVTNSLQTLFPEIASDWHPNKNKHQLNEIIAGSTKLVWWQCHICQFEWEAQVRSRTRKNSRCPNCYAPDRSAKEIKLYFELQYCFNNVDVNQQKVIIDGEIIHIDMLIPEHSLIIEYDSFQTHNHPTRLERDKRKTERLLSQGYHVVRLREEPLPLITQNDLAIKEKYTVKLCTDKLLLHLHAALKIASPVKERYLNRKKCVNTARAEAFIASYKLKKISQNSKQLVKVVKENQIRLELSTMRDIERTIREIMDYKPPPTPAELAVLQKSREEQQKARTEMLAKLKTNCPELWEAAMQLEAQREFARDFNKLFVDYNRDEPINWEKALKEIDLEFKKELKKKRNREK